MASPGRLGRRAHLLSVLPLTVALIGTCVVVVRDTSHQPARLPRAAAHSVVAPARTPPRAAAPVGHISPALRLHRVLVSDAGHAAVAALDLKSGTQVAIDANRPFFTASIEKVDIAVTLFRELAAAHQGLPEAQRDLLQRMIENSDNAAASTLWDEVGGADGVDRTNRVLGLTRTTARSSGVWGLTRTTAADQLTLLRQVVVGGALTRPDRDLLMDMMCTVEADQRWGVSAAANPHQTTAVKNGWLPHQADDYRWIINSIGLVGDRRTGMLMVVLSNHHLSETGGIRMVDRVARLTGRQLRG